MSKAIPIRTDEGTLQRLEDLARTCERSRNYLANVALKEFLERKSRQNNRASDSRIPIAERLEDYRSAFWREDDGEALRTYLEEERRRGLQSDRLSDLE